MKKSLSDGMYQRDNSFLQLCRKFRKDYFKATFQANDDLERIHVYHCKAYSLIHCLLNVNKPKEVLKIIKDIERNPAFKDEQFETENKIDDS